jgi:hypothetical protein
MKGFKPIVFARIGKIEIRREDRYNWSVIGDGRTGYFVSLPTAVLCAARRYADCRSKDLASWLEEFRRVSARLEAKCSEVIESTSENFPYEPLHKDPGPGTPAKPKDRLKTIKPGYQVKR